MRRLWLLLLLGVLPSSAHAWGRFGSGAQPVTQNAGDKAKGISVTISTPSATLVVTGDTKFREILLQNTDAVYYISCSTFSALTAVSGQPRWLLPPKPTGFTTNFTGSIYCILDPAAGSGTAEVVGSIEYDSKDIP